MGLLRPGGCRRARGDLNVVFCYLAGPNLEQGLRRFSFTGGGRLQRMEIWIVWLARLLFLGIFLMAGGMLFRAWRIAVRRDMRYVADWRGQRIPNGEQWVAWVLSINLIGAGSLLAIGFSVLVAGLAFVVWSGLAGLVLWSYYFLLRVVVSRANRGQKA